MLNFYRSCVVAAAAMLLSGCLQVTEGQFNTSSASLRGSAAFKRAVAAKCVVETEGKSFAYRKSMAALMNITVDAMPKIYCRRFLDALASGRMTYAIYMGAYSRTGDRSKFVEIIQGR